jgi:nicotinate-nucleotide adenylyltransferase
MTSIAVELSSRVAIAAARIERALEDGLTPARRAHVLGVASYAVWLAGRFGEDPSRARLAALGHDMTREWDPDEMYAWAIDDGRPLSALERSTPKLLHGRAAAVLLRREYQVCDAEVLAAVRDHTLGATGMTPLQKILFCADYLEPGRPFIEPEFRSHVEGLGLDEMLCACVEHNAGRGHELAERTREMYREICGKEYAS